MANLGLYAIALAVFGVIKAKECSDIVLQVREAKACSYRPEKHKQMFLVTNFLLHFFTLQYRWIAYLSIFIGCGFLVVFHIGTNEPTYVDRSFWVDICAVRLCLCWMCGFADWSLNLTVRRRLGFPGATGSRRHCTIKLLSCICLQGWSQTSLRLGIWHHVQSESLCFFFQKECLCS